MMYRIQRSIANDRKTWVQSDSYPGTYSWYDAEEIRVRTYQKTDMRYRMVPVMSVVPKPYRRHAAVTALELRGAVAMLDDARYYIIRVGEDNQTAWKILLHARVEVWAQLEKL